MASSDALPFEGDDISIGLSSTIDFLEQRLGLITKSISNAILRRQTRTLLRLQLSSVTSTWVAMCELDLDIRTYLRESRSVPEVHKEAKSCEERLNAALQNQALISQQLVDHLDTYEQMFPTLEKLISEARVACQEAIDAATPDDEFFTDVEELEQQAIEEHRAGRTVDYDCI